MTDSSPLVWCWCALGLCVGTPLMGWLFIVALRLNLRASDTWWLGFCERRDRGLRGPGVDLRMEGSDPP
ncbi:MAG: hypothetical protein JWO08_2356 [Verrucomicrobiaceae bacterium]|nr:hypothetical protein [Verrucomicrobiaceae bacterium]